MASFNGPASDNRRDFSPAVALLVITLGILGGAWLLLRPAIPALPSSHAVETHGEDALAARDCLGRNGVFDTWQEPNRGAIHQLCQDDDGTIYDQIVTKDSNGKWVEKTAFEPKKETGNLWRDIIDWLTRKGATRIKGIQ